MEVDLGEKPPGPTLVEEPELATSELEVVGMHCNACATRIERALSGRNGVVSASVNLATRRAFVAFEPTEVTPTDLCAAVNGAGYSASEIGSSEQAPAKPTDTDRWKLRIAVSWPLALGALGVALFAPEDALAGWVVLVLAIVVELVGGWPFLRTAARLIVHGATNMDTLVTVGTLAALAVSAVEAIALGGRHVHLGGSGAFAARLHGVMAPLIVSILATGRAVEASARGRAGEALHAILSLRPPTARIVSGPTDDGTLVPPESVPVGALFKVMPAEAIPLDGVVVEGRSEVDESMLTGEPLPVLKEPKDTVTGGTRNGGSSLVVEASSTASESVLARLQRLVDEAQRDKPPLQRMADRISAVFVPAVLIGALVTFLAWWLAAGNFGTAVLAAVAVLLVACPCAMGLATPVAMMVGSGRAAALGVLVKSGDALERLSRVDSVVFDKTGTLTEQRAIVTFVSTVEGVTEDRLLSLAAAVEVESEHPVATAIRDAAREVCRASDVESVPGQGVSGTVDGRLVFAGRLDSEKLPEGLAGAADDRLDLGETVISLRVDGEAVGVIALSMATRPEARGTVSRLHSMGIRTMVMSGDSGASVGAVSRSLSIDEWVGGLTPSQKLEALQAQQAAGRRVVMVGDGVNDAPALAAAYVGCSIGSGTEAALENSDVALLGSDLHGVPSAISMARSTSGIIVQNFGWAMGYNLAALPLAAAGLLDPLVAALAMGASSLVVVLNSLRLLKLGRRGIEQVGSTPRVRGARAFAFSMLLPVVVFAGGTAVTQAFSPARGQPLLPSLPGITTISLANGDSAEFYLEPGSPGVNQVHMLILGTAGTVSSAQLTLTHDGVPAGGRRLARFAPGHYIAVADLSAGRWRFDFTAQVGERRLVFHVERDLG